MIFQINMQQRYCRIEHWLYWRVLLIGSTRVFYSLALLACFTHWQLSDQTQWSYDNNFNKRKLRMNSLILNNFPLHIQLIPLHCSHTLAITVTLQFTILIMESCLLSTYCKKIVSLLQRCIGVHHRFPCRYTCQ